MSRVARHTVKAAIFRMLRFDTERTYGYEVDSRVLYASFDGIDTRRVATKRTGAMYVYGDFSN